MLFSNCLEWSYAKCSYYNKQLAIFDQKLAEHCVEDKALAGQLATLQFGVVLWLMPLLMRNYKVTYLVSVLQFKIWKQYL
jgi:hypothetical protein